MVKLAELDVDQTLQQPVLAILEIPAISENEDILHETSNQPTDHDRHGVSLLQHISSQKADSKFSKMVISIAMLHEQRDGETSVSQGLGGRLTRPSSGGLDKIGRSMSSKQHEASTLGSSILEPWKVIRCLNAGASDVLSSPLSKSRIAGLTVHACRAREEARKDRAVLLAKKRVRKRSWVGFDDQKPYAYLREQMYAPNACVCSFDLMAW